MQSNVPKSILYVQFREAQWPIGYGVALRIKRSSVRIRPWPLRWVLGQGSLLPLSQGEAFTSASISYLAILVKYILAKKRKKKFQENFCSMQSDADIFNCGQRKMLSEPLCWGSLDPNRFWAVHSIGFTTSTIELIQSVGMVTSAIMSCSSNCSSLRLTWSLNATGTRRGASWTGCTSGFRRMLYSPGIWPVCGPNTFGNFFIRLSADRGSLVSSWYILVFSHSTCLPFISSVSKYLRIFNCMQDFQPKSGLTLSPSITRHSILHCNLSLDTVRVVIPMTGTLDPPYAIRCVFFVWRFCRKW